MCPLYAVCWELSYLEIGQTLAGFVPCYYTARFSAFFVLACVFGGVHCVVKSSVKPSRHCNCIAQTLRRIPQRWDVEQLHRTGFVKWYSSLIVARLHPTEKWTSAHNAAVREYTSVQTPFFRTHSKSLARKCSCLLHIWSKPDLRLLPLLSHTNAVRRCLSLRTLPSSRHVCRHMNTTRHVYERTGIDNILRRVKMSTQKLHDKWDRLLESTGPCSNLHFEPGIGALIKYD